MKREYFSKGNLHNYLDDRPFILSPILDLVWEDHPLQLKVCESYSLKFESERVWHPQKKNSHADSVLNEVALGTWLPANLAVNLKRLLFTV